MKGNFVSLSPATVSEDGAFMIPPPFRADNTWRDLDEIFKYAAGDREPYLLTKNIFVSDIKVM